MSRTAQTSIDGINVDFYKFRKSGSVEVEEPEADAAVMDAVVVTVEVSKVDDVQYKSDKDGNVTRIAVLKTTEARVLEGDLKALLVERLGLYGTDTAEPILITPGERTPSQREAKAEEDEKEEIIEDDDDEQPGEPDGVVGHIRDHVSSAAKSGMSNVKPFNATSFDGPNDTEVVGRIKPKDDALGRFLGEVG